jgi:hypothetical protein
MKFSRIGESLWQEWDGEDYSQNIPDSIVFFTIGHPDLDHEVVRRALASTIQRDGSVDSLGDAYKAIQNGEIIYGHGGVIGEDRLYTVCDAGGETYYGDHVEETFPMTWVEVKPDGR